MLAFILRRLVFSVPVLIGILIVTFIMGRSIPGDACRGTLGEKATQEMCDVFNERYGYDKPLPTQFVVYISNILKGDFGTSLRFGRPVLSLITERFPVTLELAFFALIFACIVGIPLGILSAYRHNTGVDVATMIGANIGVSMPVFWLGLMLAFLFGVVLKDTPFGLPPSSRLTPGVTYPLFYVQWGWAESEKVASGLLAFLGRLNFLNALLTLNWALFVDALRHMILPAVAVGTIPLAIIARITRSSVLETLSQDYVRTARAKGLRERAVVLRHALSNALLPVVTIIGLNFGGLIACAVLTETIFGFSGIGKSLSEGITARDYALVQGVTIITALAFLIVNLAVDILYGFLDPRIRIS